MGTRIRKYAIATIGAIGGVAIYMYQHYNENKQTVYNSWTTNTIVPLASKWDPNWDHRDPKSLVKPLSDKSKPGDENRFNEKIEAVNSKAVRHIILVRHGQYNMEGKTDIDRYLTEMGRKQAEFTGLRLKALQFPWDKLIKSTMTRAQETGKIITEVLNTTVPIENCPLLQEGAPIPPEPPVGHWRPEKHQFYQDGARIEAAFRKYFHRADADQVNDTYTLIVCHANVIRYLVCRALQFPPEAWLRLSLHHASITWITIHASGRVILRQLGDSGHIPPAYLSYS